MAPINFIKQTWKKTQFARSVEHYPFRKHYKSRFPALNVRRRNEVVATDTIFADVPAIDDGSRCAQIFVGLDSMVVDVYGMKTDKEFTKTLEDNIHKWGAMDKLVSDIEKSETSGKVKDILRLYGIDDWQSEAHFQHQNPIHSNRSSFHEV